MCDTEGRLWWAKQHLTGAWEQCPAAVGRHNQPRFVDVSVCGNLIYALDNNGALYTYEPGELHVHHKPCTTPLLTLRTARNPTLYRAIDDNFQLRSVVADHAATPTGGPEQVMDAAICGRTWATIDNRGDLWLHRDVHQPPGDVPSADLSRLRNGVRYTRVVAGVGCVVAIDEHKNVWGGGDNLNHTLGATPGEHFRRLGVGDADDIIVVGDRCFVLRGGDVWTSGVDTRTTAGFGSSGSAGFVRVYPRTTHARLADELGHHGVCIDSVVDLVHASGGAAP